MWTYDNTYNELYHYGVLGMRWGVRRYRNKDGSLTAAGRAKYADAEVIKKGTGYSHISKTALKKPKNYKVDFQSNRALGVSIPKVKSQRLYAYKTDNKHDEMVYKGAYSRYLTNGIPFFKTVENKYVTQYDGLSPSKKERINTILEIAKKNTALVNKVVNRNNQLIEASGNKALKKFGLLTGYEKNKHDKLLNNLSVSQVFDDKLSNKFNKQYFKSLYKKGYDIITDDNNKKAYNKAETPVIFLKPKTMLGKAKETRDVTAIEQDNYFKELEKKLKGRVML